MKIALDRGHAAVNPDTGWFDPGAVNGKYQEHQLASDIIVEMSKLLQGNVPYFIPRATWDTRERYVEAISNGCTHYLCIHINASINASANGAECWWWRNNSLDFAGNVMSSLKTFANRGVYQKNGVLGQQIATIPYAFLELGFISNQNDLQKLLSEKATIARELCNALELTMGVKIVKKRKVKLILNQQGTDKDKVFRSVDGGKPEVIVQLDGHMPFIDNRNHLALRDAIKILRSEAAVRYDVNTKITTIEWEE